MATAKLRALSRSGRTLDELATLNEAETGWRPTRSTVSKKLLALGETPRHASRRDLMPWQVKPEHNSSRFRLMLQAESRRRSGLDLSNTDLKNVDLLTNLTMGRGVPLVIGYDRVIGFYLADRTDADTDIIRFTERSGLRDLDQSLNDADLAERSRAIGVSPDQLENIGRDNAADLLRRLIVAEAMNPAEESTHQEPATRKSQDSRVRKVAG